MKKIVILLYILSPFFVLSQSINDYEKFIVPVRFEFQSEDNQYRMSTILKANLEKLGIKATYSTETSQVNYADRCSILTLNLVKTPNLLRTKLQLQFIDCDGKTVYETPVFDSKEKDRSVAFRECLDLIFESMQGINYVYNGSKPKPVVAQESIVVQETILQKQTPPAQKPFSFETVLYAQPTDNGFQLVDATPRVVMKIFKTSQPDFFTASYVNTTGMVLKKDGIWVFEYTEAGVLKAIPMQIKF
uniref:hypothetical protein n=1 Tax=Flavobacterium sp. TaxID=239 RepID=UPI00404B6B16